MSIFSRKKPQTAGVVPQQWKPTTKGGKAIKRGDKFWWIDRAKKKKPRWVKVRALEPHSQTVLCADAEKNHHAIPPEELLDYGNKGKSL
jgi:hypothetical protein